jgi:hypothetical protein
MFINNKSPYHHYIHAFHNGEEIQLCIWFDTKDKQAMSYNGIINGRQKRYYHFGGITFKLERGKNIPEPFFTELTTDECFAGFIDD